MAEIISGNDFDRKVLSAEKIVIADFFSDTCGPCKRISPVLDEINEEYSDSLSVVKINVNTDTELAIEYGVQYVPTMIFFKNGKELTRITGAVSKAELIDTLSSL